MDFIKKKLEKHEIIILMFLIFFLTGGECIIKKITGVPCPSCGITRSFYYFVNLDFKQSFYYHPLFWLIPIVLIIVIYGKKPLFRNKKIEVTFYIIITTLILGVYIIRMVNLFPYISPMDYNKSSYIWRLLNFIKEYILLLLKI
ncbi:DUF2752 domain-containing protein [Clostridium gasigenes]|uniref:DUF2752 domain-containing protein n=1 Tax=Clostridium gasigenes TaxID=94869 RepID=UPI0014384B87|nr:DUF2752 domain-containing protein [Clostridium gasigenes]NKF07677.1 DUF2752 domain-containing protein [Clostridium gasigenes]QSW18103.1 DUF2752 domain-containing protein [Clostridium gasigenes]